MVQGACKERASRSAAPTDRRHSAAESLGCPLFPVHPPAPVWVQLGLWQGEVALCRHDG